LITVNTAANAAVQLATSPEMRGRVMGIYMLVFVGSSPVGASLVGWLSEIGGPRVGAVSAGVLVLAGAAMAVLATRFVTGRVARRRRRIMTAHACDTGLTHWSHKALRCRVSALRCDRRARTRPRTPP